MIKTRNLVGIANSQTRASRKAWVIALLPVGLGVAAFTPGCGSSFVACEENRTCTPPQGGGSASDAGAAHGGSPIDEVGGSPSGGSTVAGGRQSGGSESTIGGGPDVGEGGTDSGSAGGEPSGGGTGGSETTGGTGTGGSAGSGGAGGSGTGGTDTTEPLDKTPPTVVSVSPTNNAKGVKADATITVTWSEAMDKASAQASFQSAELAGKVTFDWPSDKVMKVTPSEPLIYAKGKHADLAALAAKTYSVALNTSAKDAAGNALAAAYAFKFTTLRQLTWSMTAGDIDTYQLGSTFTADTMDSDIGIWVGDDDNNHWYRLAVTFNIASIPTTATGITKATVALPMTPTASWTGKPLGTPFSTLGKVVLDHIKTAMIDADTLLLPPLRRVGDVTSTSTKETKVVDATIAVADDLGQRVQRNNRSQFRAQFSKDTDSDNASDAVFFGYNDLLSLTVDYLVP